MKNVVSGLVALFLYVAAHAGKPVFDITPALNDGMWNNPTSTVIEDDGTIHTAFMRQMGSTSSTKDIWYGRKNPEAAWQFIPITNNAPAFEEFPCLALDSSGNVHIAFHTGAGSGNSILYVNNVGAAPGTFNPIIPITGTSYAIVELRIDSMDVVHFVFRSLILGGAPNEIYYTTYTQGGGVGPLVNISQSPAQDDSSVQVAIDSNDKVHIVWQRGSALGGALAYVNNVGGTFQEVATGVGSVLEAFIVIDDTDKVSIFYRPGFDAMMYIETDDGRGGFTTPAPVYTGTYRSAFQERIGVDSNGHRYVVFASNIAANRGVYFVQETDEGWQAPQLLDSVEGSTNLGTSIDINSEGKLVITYSRSRFEDGVVIADIYLACTTIPQGPACPADLTGAGGNPPDGNIDVNDLFVMLANWNTAGAGADLAPPTNIVDVNDLFVLLAAWGSCD